MTKPRSGKGEAGPQRRLRRQPAARRAAEIENLTSRVAHDFNNVLAAVVGHLELLERRLADRPEAQARIRKAIENAFHGRAVAQLLSCIPEGRAGTERLIDVQELVDRVTDRVRNLGRSVEVGPRISPASLFVNDSALEAVLINLVIAAGGSSSPAGKTPRISADAPTGRRGAGRRATILISGPGLTSPDDENGKDRAFATLTLDSAVRLAIRHGGHARIGRDTATGVPECRLVFPLAST